MSFQLDQLQRETPSCTQCRSSPQGRALVGVLSRSFTPQSRIISEFPKRKEIRGLGLSDPQSFASRLSEKFDYQNTYFHQPPRLDIAGELDSTQLNSCDFVISSEVFEHVVPPVSRTFANAFRLLKPGGLLVLTVPYGNQQETIEHFPQLHNFTIEETTAGFLLKNRTREGTTEIFKQLVFHGGPGSTLEMRVFPSVTCCGSWLTRAFPGSKSIDQSSFALGSGGRSPGRFRFPPASRFDASARARA